MFALTKKMFITCILILVVLTTGAWQSGHVVPAESQNTDAPETPLYPGLTWSSLGSSTQDIKININGDSISLSGERYEAVEQFISSLPQDILNYYSNEQLAKSGWASYDAFDEAGGTHYVFYHESGAYLSVEFLDCPDVPSNICVAVWKSEQIGPAVVAPAISEPEGLLATVTFGKTAPANGATNLNPVSIVLSWGAYSPAPDKYAYCVKDDSACAANDPNWTSAYNRSITLTNLKYDKTYYWQVRAITCVTCVPKTFVYANNGVIWTFKTKTATQAVIVGNAGVAGAVLSYKNGTLKTVTANGSGNYSITVPLNWSGTVTPAKSGYVFSPKSASFSNLTVSQTIQNFTAIPAYVISGNVGLSGVTLSYTDGTPQTVTSNSNGHYSITVPGNWSGTVSPSKTGYTFLPASKSYTDVTSNKTSQNYTPLVEISGTVGVEGATLSYTDSTPKTATADGSGNYSIIVPWGWTGTATPSKTGFTFTPVSRSYSNVKSNQTAQDYTAIDAPIVLSSVRVGNTPTSDPSVDFTVTFSELVTGVDVSDFDLTTTGITGATISNVSASPEAVYTVTVDTGSGSGTLRLDVLDDDSIMDTADNPLGGVGDDNGAFTGGEAYEVNKLTSLSTKTADGWILESSENSGVGSTLNKTATTLRLGDDAANKQYLSILSFDTSALPDDVVITSVTLKFKYAGKTGTLPFSTHGNLLVDVFKGAFKGSSALQLGDFNAKGTSITYKSKALVYTNTKVDDWYSQSFSADDFDFINLEGVTQFRLRFSKDDNNDSGADYLKIYSGNAGEANRPQLIVEYYLP